MLSPSSSDDKPPPPPEAAAAAAPTPEPEPAPSSLHGRLSAMLSSTVLQLAFSTCKTTSTRHPSVRATITELKRTPPWSPASDTEETGSTLPHCVRLRLLLVVRRVAGCAGGSVPLVCACTRAKKLLKPADRFSSSLSCVGVACAARHHCECGGLGCRRYGGGCGYPASGAWLLGVLRRCPSHWRRQHHSSGWTSRCHSACWRR